MKNKKKSQNGRGENENEREREREGDLFLFFLLFASFLDLRKLDCRILSKQKAKFIHASRATRGYQNLRVSSNSMR